MASNEALFRRRMEAIPRGIGNAATVFAARARNAEIWDIEGKRYIDFASGIAVLNVGHCHPRVIDAVRSQLANFTHMAFQVMPYEPYLHLAERLSALAPIRAATQTLFFNSGAEAVENAIKIARHATGRSAVIAFSGAFHGRSMMTLALTGKTKPYKAGFGPMPGEVYHVPFPSAQSNFALEDTLRALDLLFSGDVDPSRVAAIIVEPVQGEGGFNVASTELLLALRALCDRHGILLIADEVQTGMARTGKMFAIEHSGVEADIMTLAKALGGGFPLAAVIGRKSILDGIEPGGLGSTFGGSPVACAAALAVLDVIRDESLLERATMVGERIASWVENMRTREGSVGMSAPRGLGAMRAFDVLNTKGLPDGDLAKKAASRALEHGVIILTCGSNAQALRFLPPLTIEDSVLDDGLNRLGRALASEAAA